MIVKELKREEFEPLRQQLIKKAYQNPLEFSFNVRMTVDNTEYCLKIQPDKGYKLVLLQAYTVERSRDGQFIRPIAKKTVLTSLLELLIFQGVA